MSAVVDKIMSDALHGARAAGQRWAHRAWAEAEGAYARTRASGGDNYSSVKAYDETFVYNYLFCRELPADEVIREAMKAGIHPSDVGKAHDALGIKTIVNGGCKVLWALPDETYRRLARDALSDPAYRRFKAATASPPPLKRKPADTGQKCGGLPKEI